MSGVVRKRHLVVLWTLALVIVAVLGFGLHSTVLAVDTIETKMKQNHLFLEAMMTIEQSYYDEEKTKPDRLIEHAIRGMVESLDRYSTYFTPDEAKEFNDQTQGQFEGLGIQINLEGGWLTVVQTLHGTPAERVGLKPGDRIVEIDGESTKNITLPEAVRKLKGPKGTAVKLRIARRGEDKLITKEIERDTITAPAIIEDTAKMLDSDVGYIRLQDFTKDAARELEDRISELLQQENMKALILDLRNNHGGLLDVAVDVCDLFVEKGKTVVTYRGREEQAREYVAKRSPMGDFIAVVLVNEFSASASEIVAGCLQDHHRAVIIGSGGSLRDNKPDGRTFGKGSVQTLIPLAVQGGQGAMLKLTTAKYFTPNGRSIDDEGGLMPDILAPVTPEEHYEIQHSGNLGVLPPGTIDSDPKSEAAETLEEEAETESSGDSVEAPSPEEVFEQVDAARARTEGEDDGDKEVYDTELLAAYQAAKAGLILANGAQQAR